jgi:hypothetical protein
LEGELHQDILSVIFTMVLTGLGSEFRYQNGDVVVMCRAGKAGIARIKATTHDSVA